MTTRALKLKILNFLLYQIVDIMKFMFNGFKLRIWASTLRSRVWR
jgi:hypothetical protein